MVVVKWNARNTFVNFGHELKAQLQTWKVQLALWSCLKLCSPYPRTPLTLKSLWHEIPEFGRFRDRFLLLSTFLFSGFMSAGGRKLSGARQCLYCLGRRRLELLTGRGAGGLGKLLPWDHQPACSQTWKKGKWLASMQFWSNNLTSYMQGSRGGANCSPGRAPACSWTWIMIIYIASIQCWSTIKGERTRGSGERERQTAPQGPKACSWTWKRENYVCNIGQTTKPNIWRNVSTQIRPNCQR